MYVHVHTTTCTYHVHTMYIHVYTFTEMYIHVCTCLCFSIIVYTMSVSRCTLALSKHCTYMVQTCLYTFMPGGQDSRCIVVNIGHDIGSFFWCRCKVPVQSRGELQGAKNMVNRKNKVLKLCLFLPEQRNQSLSSEISTPCRDSNPEPLPSNRHALPLSHQAK